MHLQMSRILNIILVQAKNDEERSAIMAKGNMTIRMEPELKAQAAALFKSLGMDLSTATGRNGFEYGNGYFLSTGT